MEQIPLQFSDGFVGPPIPRTNTGAGVPDSQNVCLSPDGSALMPFPGYRRTSPYRLLHKPRAGQLSSTTAAVALVLLANPTAGDVFTIQPNSADAPEEYEFYTGTYSGIVHGVELGGSISATLGNLASAVNSNTSLGITASSDGAYTLTLTTGQMESNPAISCSFPSDGFASHWVPKVVKASQQGSSSSFAYSAALSNLPMTVGYEDSYGDTLTLTVATGAWVHVCSENSILDIGKDADTKVSEVSVSADSKTQMSDISHAFSWFDTGDSLGNYTEITNSLLVVSFPPQSFYTGGGVGLGVVDQITGRVLAIAFHPGGQVPDPLSIPDDRPPKLIGKLNRQGPNDVVQFLHFQGLTHLVTPWDEHFVFDGIILRKCGIRAPYGAPEVQPRTVEFTAGEESESIADETKWLYGPTVGAWTANISGFSSIAVTNSAGKTAAQDTSTTDTDDDGVLDTMEFIALKYVANGATKLKSVFTCNSPVYPNTPTGYSPVSIRIEKFPLAGSGMLKYLEWRITYTDGTTQKVSFGKAEQRISLLWKKTISKIDLYNKADVDDDIPVRVAIRVSVQWYNSTPGAGNPFWAEGKRMFCFAWYDSKNVRESAPSPYTDVIEMSETAWKINIGGVLRENGLTWNNSNPDPGVVDKVRVYTHNTTWGTNDLGYPIFHLAGTFDVPTPDADGNAWVDLPGVTEDELLGAAVPQYENNVLPGGAAIAADRQRIVVANQPSFSVGRCVCLGTPNRIDLLKCWMNTSAEKVWATADPSGKTFTCSTAVSDTSASWTCASDGTLAWCETWTRSTGTKTAGTYTLYDAYSPTWGPWMEGREITLGTEGKFTVSKVLSDHMWVYKYTSLSDYKGLDYSAHFRLMDYELIGQPNRIAWSTNTINGIDPESTPQAGYKLLDMPGDEILALGHCGEYLVAVGRKHLVYMIQDSGQVDGLISSGDPYPNPRSDQGGCVSGRTFAQIGNQTAFFLGADGKLMILTPNGAEVHPVSVRTQGYFTNQFRLSASALKNAHAVYDPVRNWVVVFFGDSGIGPDGNDNTDKFGTWPGQPPLDNHVSWVAQS